MRKEKEPQKQDSVATRRPWRIDTKKGPEHSERRPRPIAKAQNKLKSTMIISNTHLGANLDGAQRGEQHDAHHNRGKASHCFAGVVEGRV